MRSAGQVVGFASADDLENDPWWETEPRRFSHLLFEVTAVECAGCGGGNLPVAPAFTSDERAIIAAWTKTSLPPDLHVEITSRFEFLMEALIVAARPTDEPWWLVHKTNHGTIAVRLWPGLATIHATLPEALAVITAATGRSAPGAPPG